MGVKQLGWVGMAAVAVMAVGLVIQASSGEGGKAAAPVKLGEKSVTVFPIVVTPKKDIPADMGKRLGEVVGMLLERADMKDVRLSEAGFSSKEGATIDQVADDFGKFVVEQEIDTPYALLAEILGERKKGIDAIRTIVVDAKGNVVLSEETPKKAFAKSGPVAPKDPMTCCVFIANRLREPWGLADPLRENAPGGKVQENWRKKSGIPSDEEIAAIKERAKELG